MAIFNYAAREMTAKIVYYGPGLSGKTTSIQHIHSKINPKSKGKLVSLATETDRTLFFDFFPLDFGQIGGFKVKFNFYTVPGQVFYNTTRKLVLKGADGVVFVADSQPGMMDQNLESLQNLEENLKTHGIDPETVPFIIQYNKRDIAGALSLDELRGALNPKGVPEFETVATTGVGVMEAMKVICRMVLEDIQRKQRSVTAKGSAPRAAAPPPAKEPAAAAPLQASTVTRPAERPEAAKPATVERSVSIPVGAGASRIVLRLPLDLELEAGADAIEVTAEIRVNHGGRPGKVVVRELAVEEAAEASGERKGLLSRLFGK